MVQSKSNPNELPQEASNVRWNPPPHPGEIIRRRFLEDTGASQVEICKRFKIEKTRFNRILTGRADINVEDSRDLGRAFGMNPLFFLDLQIKYNEAKERRPDAFNGSLTSFNESTSDASERDAG